MALPASLLKVRPSGGTPTTADLLRVQDNVGTLLNAVAAVPILSGMKVAAVEFGSAAHPSLTYDVPHGLGRPWQDWLITDQDQPAQIYRSSTANREKFLTLTADGTVTINLWVW